MTEPAGEPTLPAAPAVLAPAAGRRSPQETRTARGTIRPRCDPRGFMAPNVAAPHGLLLLRPSADRCARPRDAHAVRQSVRRRRRNAARWPVAWLVCQATRAAAATPDVDPAAPPALAAALTYESTALADVAGGRRTGVTALGNLHLKLTGRGDALGHPGASAFIDLLSIHGGSPTRLVGDAQDTSNIEGPTGAVVEEAWVQQNFAGDALSVLAGLYDLNSEFYSLPAAGLFLNGSFGIGPEFAQSCAGGPSIFPRTSVGLRAAWNATAGSVLRLAVLDGMPAVRNNGALSGFHRSDGVLAVAEYAVQATGGDGGAGHPAAVPAPGGDRIGRFAATAPWGDKFALGLWHYTGQHGDAGDLGVARTSAQHAGSSGAYAIGERELMRGSTAGARLSGFVQAGVADPRTNRFGAYLGAGAVAAGWGTMRDGDPLGLALAHAVNGSHYQRAADRDGGAARAETTFELSYLTPLAKGVTVQPDLQYVVHPNTDRSVENAWVLQCRVLLEF